MKWPVIVLAVLAAAPAEGATLSGRATVIDGDSVELAGVRVRLFAIDAPEGRQTCDRNGEAWACGEAAAEQLKALIGEAELVCEGDEYDDFGRLLAVCSVAGVDVNRTMVAGGWAIAFRRYSENYVNDEARARASRLGIWSSSFVPPELYRQLANERPAGAPSTDTRPVRSSSTGCLIKGNRNSRGEWIYHLPGRPYYAQTRAEEMFCTEDEAVAAGYRRSRAR